MFSMFEPGKTYTTRSACDHNCIFTMKVLSRTDVTIKAVVEGKPKTLRPAVDEDGVEFVFPMGRYSMAPVIRAE